MNDPWKVTGKWWLPEAPEQLWNGTLNWDPKGRSRLNIAGVMKTAERSSTQMGPGPELVLGCSDEGVYYTIYRTYFSGYTGGWANDNYQNSHIDVETIFRKAHFAKREDVRFGRVRVAYSNLHEWYWGTPAISRTEVPDAKGNYNGSQATVTHQRRELWDVLLENGIRLENDFNYTYNHTENPTPKLTFTHTDGLLITAEKPSELGATFLDSELQFRTLINLIGDYRLEPVSVRGALDPEGSTEVDIFAYRMRTRGERQERNPDNSPVLFQHLGGTRFADVLQTWFKVYEQAKTVVHLYLSDRLSGSLELDSTFLAVMQALEAYHHLFYPTHVYMPRTDYKQRVLAPLIKAIPEDLEQTVKQKVEEVLRYGFQYSLKRKLEEIVAELPEGELRNEAANSEFLTRSVNTRNYLVHRDPEAESKAFKHGELYRGGLIWQEVIFALLLGRSGFQRSEISRAGGVLRRNRGILQVVGNT